MIKLINVIEISPLLYAKDDYELPETSDDPDPEEWFSRWEEAASQLNFNFKIIEKGSYLADIETIDDENLQMILEERLKDFEKIPKKRILYWLLTEELLWKKTVQYILSRPVAAICLI